MRTSKTLILNLHLEDTTQLFQKALKRCRGAAEILVIDQIWQPAFRLQGRVIERKYLREYITNEFLDEVADWLQAVLRKLGNYGESTGRKPLGLIEYDGIRLWSAMKLDFSKSFLREMLYYFLIMRILEIEEPSAVVVLDRRENEELLPTEGILSLIRSKGEVPVQAVIY